MPIGIETVVITTLRQGAVSRIIIILLAPLFVNLTCVLVVYSFKSKFSRQKTIDVSLKYMFFIDLPP